jgi:hypothetical protein
MSWQGNPRLNSRLRVALVCLFIGLSLTAIDLYLRRQPAPVPRINMAQNQINIMTRTIVDLHVTILDSTERSIPWAVVNVTYICDYITQQGSLIIQNPNGTNTATLDCGVGSSPHQLSVHVTVTALGFDEYTFTDSVTFYGKAKELSYVVHLTHSLFAASTIALENFSLCVENRSKLVNLEGLVFVHGNMPIVWLHVFINGSDLGKYPPAIFSTATATNGAALNYSFPFGIQLTPEARISVKTGYDYRIAVTAFFIDNSTSTASMSVVAQSGSCSYLGMG